MRANCVDGWMDELGRPVSQRARARALASLWVWRWCGGGGGGGGAEGGGVLKEELELEVGRWWWVLSLTADLELYMSP